MIFYRTFIKEIACTITIPEEPNNHKLLFICPGLPSQPDSFDIMSYFTNKGFYCVYPKYRGTWESFGDFLEKSPSEDIKDILSYISKERNFIDAYSQDKKELDFNEIAILGSSFGGSVALTAGALAKNINKIVAIAPVTDFRTHGKDEQLIEQDLEHLGEFLMRAYGRAYNLKKDNWYSLLQGKIDLNASDYIDALSQKKNLFIHGQSDETVAINRSRQFINKLENQKNQLLVVENTGHLSLRSLTQDLLDKISIFLTKD